MAPMYDIGSSGTAARGRRMTVTLRLKEELVAEIDRVAAAHGQSRSCWIDHAG